MATNSSRGNPIGARDGPKTSTGAEVPPIGEDTKQDLAETSTTEATGEHVPGQDPTVEAGTTEEGAAADAAVPAEAAAEEGEQEETKSKKKH
ncbi:valine--tRNA ligase [Podospora pseudocomata]|uniref:Valine--tRNA ligase n=1 Tax=Podospora pseudocomata TaxID=2093779 RepID=A0ABR0GUW9_9PEZI|nr:valine--tRNA ligase [Podospora pseudocomata]